MHTNDISNDVNYMFCQFYAIEVTNEKIWDSNYDSKLVFHDTSERCWNLFTISEVITLFSRNIKLFPDILKLCEYLCNSNITYHGQINDQLKVITIRLQLTPTTPLNHNSLFNIIAHLLWLKTADEILKTWDTVKSKTFSVDNNYYFI